MKRLFALLTMFTTLDLFCQTIGQSFELPPDSLIRKYHVKTIKSYFSNDSEKNTLDVIWKFDTSGNLISKELIDKEDPSVDKDLYFYKDKKIIERWKIGTWAKYDTLRTYYSYDEKDRLTKLSSKSRYGQWKKQNGIENTTHYKYINDSITIVTYEGNGLTARETSSDSLVYYPNKLLHYEYNKSNDLKISYSYNTQKQIISKIETSISDFGYVRIEDKFKYTNGLLTQEDHFHTDFRDKNKISHSTTKYINNSKGLLEKVERDLTNDKYEYDFYQ